MFVILALAHGEITIGTVLYFKERLMMIFCIYLFILNQTRDLGKIELFNVVPLAPHNGHSKDVTVSDFLNQTFIFQNTEINGILALDGA